MQTIGSVAPAAIFGNLMINDSGVQTPDQFIGHLTQLKADVLAACAARAVATPSWVQVIPYKLDNPTGRYQGRTGPNTSTPSTPGRQRTLPARAEPPGCM